MDLKKRNDIYRKMWGGKLNVQCSDEVGQDDYVKRKLLSSCSSCQYEGQPMAAVQYCVDCEEYQCTKCFKFHDKYNKGHEVYDASSKQKWGTKRQVQLPTERCPTHIGEIIQLYCENHAALCCHVCIDMEHSTCRKRQYIPEVAKNISKQNKEFVTLSDILHEMQTKIENVIDDSKLNKASIIKSKLKFKQQLQETRQQFGAWYTQLEKKSNAELVQSHDKLDIETDDNIKNSNALLVEVKYLRERINPDTYTNASQLFINMTKVRGRLTDMAEKIEQVSQPQSTGFQCKPIPQIRNFLETTEGILISQKTSSQLTPTNIFWRVNNWMRQKFSK